MICHGNENKPEGYEGCWEYWKCSDEAKKECPVYQSKEGKKCWMYMDNLDVFDWAKPKKEFHSCEDCPWYKKMQEVGA